MKPAKTNPFTKPDTKKNEAAERKTAGSKANYAKMEKKFEGKKFTGGRGR